MFSPHSLLSGMFIHAVISGGKTGANVCMFAHSLLESNSFNSPLPLAGQWGHLRRLNLHKQCHAAAWVKLRSCLLTLPVLFFRVRSQVTILQASEYLQRMRADMRGTNLLGALSWVYQQPMQRSYPRQVFIITDGSISNVAKVLELVRRNACAGRYYLHRQK